MLFSNCRADLVPHELTHISASDKSLCTLLLSHQPLYKDELLGTSPVGITELMPLVPMQVFGLRLDQPAGNLSRDILCIASS